jgi:hypothetical protein
MAPPDRGSVRRMPNPEDRRSTLVEITDAGRAIADRLLAGIRILERDALDQLSPRERSQLLALLEKLLTRLAALSDAPPIRLEGRCNRPNPARSRARLKSTAAADRPRASKSLIGSTRRSCGSAMRLVAEARDEDPDLSLTAVVKRMGDRSG